ncbi:zinc-binding alcohol dehydrogenase, partial [Candidatus Calescamantes bacterium]|nr:zinc-binding alcohol dehydrogenase [Candidatus Calescamantes bacterium]
MNQLTQKLKNGKMEIVEVPLPCLQHGQILVKNLYSLISAGTETSTLKTARKGYIGKAKERPQQVKQVIDTLKTQGITQTYRAVMKKLDAYSPLGYSCAGEVIGLGSDVKGFCVGDVVACGGFTASHAEAVCVPENLCVKLRPDTDLKQAAYNTLGAIALQGVRQADLRLGETCAIIGMGLLGQLTALLLRASGIRTVGIDIDPVMIDIAEKHCLDLALHREKIGIEKKILQFTEGLGCDAVIITAASGSLDPINFAGAISRKRSTVVVVGAVPTGFDREPHFYKKELQVKMSCSYGPGRYDPNYENKGLDYPPAYVRWTENRNMQAFQELIYSQKIDVCYLTTHIFKLGEAPAAYDLIMAKSEPFIGILIEYDPQITQISQKRVEIRTKTKPLTSTLRPSTVSIGFIGAGSYAQSQLL